MVPLTFIDESFSMRGPIIPREISFEMDDLPDWVTSAPTATFSADTEMSWECDLGPAAAKLFGLDLAGGPDVTASSVIFKSPQQKQIRRHRKKRINKKWNKKFGPKYITTFELCELEGVRFDQRGSEITVVGERARMLTPNGPFDI